MARIRYSAAQGTLTADISDSDTTLDSAELADFPEVAAPDIAALILDPGGLTGAPEVVWVTDHAASATTATVLRGQETDRGGAVARAHLTGVVWRNGPTPADFDPPDTSAADAGDVWTVITPGQPPAFSPPSGSSDDPPQYIDLTAETDPTFDLDLSTGPYAVADGVKSVFVVYGAGPVDFSVTPPNDRTDGIDFTVGLMSGTVLSAAVDVPGANVHASTTGVLSIRLFPAPPGFGGSMDFAPVYDTGGGGSGPALSDDDPDGLGTLAAPGSSGDASRSDHVHPMPTQDDVGDGTTYKQYPATDKAKVALLSGTNTGDQTLAGLGGVPTSRTLAGLDLSADRSAATLKTALSIAVADVSGAAPLASPALTGTPTAPTATAGTSTTQVATTAFATTADALKADLASPALTGNPTAPTQTAGNNSTRLATTAYADTGRVWDRHILIPSWQKPDSVTGTWVWVQVNSASGGYGNSGSTNTQVWTYTDLALDAGTWALDVWATTFNGGGIATFTLGGTGIGTVDTYTVATVNSALTTLTGITVSTAGRVSLVITNPTKNATPSTYTLRISALVLRRTGP